MAVEKLHFGEPEKAEPGKQDYKVGDTVTIEGTEFIIENISDREVQLRDPKLLYPIFRAESRENFERLMAKETENAMPVQPVTTKQAEPKKAAQIDKSNAVNFHITDDALGISESKAKEGFRLKRNSGGISKQSAPLRRLRREPHSHAGRTKDFITVCRMGRSCGCL